MKLLTKSTKTQKSEKAKLGYLNRIMYLLPEKSSGFGNVCPNASKGCAASCLVSSGFGRCTRVTEVRRRRTELFFKDRKAFKQLLYKELENFNKLCKQHNLKAAVRLNGTSDIPFFNIWPDLYMTFGDIQFYEYTKSKLTMLRFLSGDLPKNLHVTFSRSEVNEKDCELILRLGGNVAAVFQSLPDKYLQFPVINADETDLRFLDPKNVVCGLIPKGKAKKDNTGFVIPSQG